jgi:hypothetical protein
MDNKLLRFLGTAFLLFRSQSVPTSGSASEKKLDTVPKKKQRTSSVDERQKKKT